MWKNLIKRKKSFRRQNVSNFFAIFVGKKISYNCQYNIFISIFKNLGFRIFDRNSFYMNIKHSNSFEICCQYLEGQHMIWKEIRTGSDSIKKDSKGAFVGEFEKRIWYNVLRRHHMCNDSSILETETSKGSLRW